MSQIVGQFRGDSRKLDAYVLEAVLFKALYSAVEMETSLDH